MVDKNIMYQEPEMEIVLLFGDNVCTVIQASGEVPNIDDANYGSNYDDMFSF